MLYEVITDYPSNNVRLVSFDMASKDDGSGDLSFTVYVQDTDDFLISAVPVTALGDVDNTTHTLVDFGGTPIEGPVDKGVSIFWPASEGRVAIDNVQFEIVGPPPPPQMVVTLPGHRITSYNVCYTKLLRHDPAAAERAGRGMPMARRMMPL